MVDGRARASLARRRGDDRSGDAHRVSTLSAREIATLARRGRISLDRDIRLWVRQAFAQPRVAAIAPGPDVAIAAALLDPEAFPGDPMDRLIYATARDADAVLVTRDRALRGFDPRNTLW